MRIKNKVLLIMPISTMDWGTQSVGGVDSVCQMLVKELSEQKTSEYEYRVLAFDPSNSVLNPGKIIQLSESIEIVFFNISNGKKWPNIISQYNVVSKQIKTFKPDMIHSHLLSWIINLSVNVPSLVTLHGYKKISRKNQGVINNFVFEHLVPFVSRFFVDNFTCVTKSFQTELAKTIIKPISVIYNPIENNYFKNTTQKKGIGNTISIVTCALLTKRKGIHHILEVLKLLKIQGTHASLTIIGSSSEPSYVDSLHEFIRLNNLADHVVFTGHKNTNEIIEIYNKSDLGLFLSEEETFGLVPLEMLANGLPVIASKTGIMKDLIMEEKYIQNLAIVEYSDYEKVTNEIISLRCINDFSSDQLPALQVNELFSVNSIVNQYETTYNELLEQG